MALDCPCSLYYVVSISIDDGQQHSRDHRQAFAAHLLTAGNMQADAGFEAGP